jgi:ubiquinone/menaquinone biosynthesis C-methylase UbiE
LRELATQALASTERGYDLLAPKFDVTPFRTPEPIVAAMAAAVGPPRSIDAGLDACCGTGAMLRHLAMRCRTRAVGIDFSRGMLDEARRRLGDADRIASQDMRLASSTAEWRCGSIELVNGDVLALPYDAEFDVVTCAGALGHIDRPDEDRFVAGVARALRRGGRFVFATTRRPPPTSAWFWLAHGFNAVMRARNALRAPPFVMYYLTFAWPDVTTLLERHGFAVRAVERACARPYAATVVVVATKQ